jgi:hypothetical protein
MQGYVARKEPRNMYGSDRMACMAAKRLKSPRTPTKNPEQPSTKSTQNQEFSDLVDGARSGEAYGAGENRKGRDGRRGGNGRKRARGLGAGWWALIIIMLRGPFSRRLGRAGPGRVRAPDEQFSWKYTEMNECKFNLQHAPSILCHSND